MHIFKIPKETVITKEIVQDFINQHRKRLPRYERLEKLYKGKHDILQQAPKDPWKPDNRLVVNFAKYITDTFNGFFIGVPVQVSIEDIDINNSIFEFRSRNTMDDNEAELSKMADIYGHAYEYLFQNENSQTDATYLNPKNGFVVYDDTIEERPVFGVHYSRSKDKENRDIIKGELLTKNEIIELKGTFSDIQFGDSSLHYFQDVPLIEYIENEERMGLFEPVETLINALNKTLSEKANDVDYFSDAYLKALGAEIEESTIANIRDSRIINLFGEGSENAVVDFMQKPSADETQENLINRLIDFIYQISMVANITDDTFNSASSGIALEYKLSAMMNLALTKERKFRAAMFQRYKMIFSIPTNVPTSKKDTWTQIKLNFKRNLPHNLLGEVQAAQGLAAITSQETALSVLSIVDNPIQEIQRIQAENKPAPLNYDFLEAEE